MKKLIFIILCLFSIKVVYANTLEYEYLPYYVKIKNIGGEEEIVQIKKVYDEDNNVVFNLDFNNYDTVNNFNKYTDINKNNYGFYFRYINYFNTIVYYGYNQNQTDLNYLITQRLIWELINNCTVKITDNLGNIIDTYDKDYTTIRNNVMNHNSNTSFYNKTFTSEIWDTMTFTYYNHNLLLDNKLIDGLSFGLNNRNLMIYNDKVGNYKVELYKNYEHSNYSYNDGLNIYWQSLGGPEDISKYFYYNVTGIKLEIEENLIGVNNRLGDAKNNSKYELYLDDELKLVIDDLNNNYVKSNSNYVLKDISLSTGIYNTDDIYFKVLEDTYKLIIDKYVITKNITLNILDNNTYYIYLESNNELYEIINKDSDVITLPYGNYYITDNNSYYSKLEVLNNIDEVLTIDNTIKEEIIKEDIVKNEIVEEDVIIEEIDNTKDIILENPKTIDNIYLYIMLFIFSIITLIINKYYLRKYLW